MTQIPFSLVSTCRNEIKSLPRWKENIQKQTRQPKEIIIVDAFSDDGTYEFLVDWAEEDSRLKILQKKGAAAFGRNTAIEQSSYSHILSTDLGVRLNEVWCEELIKPFEQNGAIEVVAGNTCIDKETVRSVASRAEYYIEDGGIADLKPGFVIGNRSSAYLKRVWKEVGKLPEDLTFYADDSVFGRQIVERKYNMAFAPNAMTYWGRPENFSQFWKEQINYGRGGGEAGIKMPYFFRKYSTNRIPWKIAILGNAMWNMRKQSKLKAFKKALQNRDFVGFWMIPVLAFGNGWHRMIGYKSGYFHGEKHCLDCRRRLTQKW